MIERSHLRILSTLNECGTLADAASRLCVTQSALTHSIKKMESTLGISAWRKEGRRLILTPAGERMLSFAQRVLPQFEKLENDMRRMGLGQMGELRVGMECHPCYEWLLRIVRPFLEQWPDVDVDVLQRFQFNGLEALKKHQIDMQITSDPINEPWLENIPVFDFELVLVQAANQAETGEENVKPEHFKAMDLITFPVDRSRLDIFTYFLTPASIEPRAHKTVEATEVMLALVSSGRGVCVLPKWLVERYQKEYSLITSSLGLEGIKKTLYLVCRKVDMNTAYIKSFVAMAQSGQI